MFVDKTHQFDVHQLVTLSCHGVLLATDVRHVAPVVCAICACRRGSRCVVHAIGSGTVDHYAEIVDVGLVGDVPVEVNVGGLL